MRARMVLYIFAAGRIDEPVVFASIRMVLLLLPPDVLGLALLLLLAKVCEEILIRSVLGSYFDKLLNLGT